MTTPTSTKSTWFLIARRTGAVIFSNQGRGTPLELVAEIDNPRGALQSGELETDRPGRSFDRAGFGRHGLTSAESAREHVEHEFATQLVGRLDKGRCENLCDRLVIVAGPKLLGMLRAAMNEPTRHLVTVELNKEINLTERDLRLHLEGMVPF